MAMTVTEKERSVYGYIRVSTRNQHTDRQLAALRQQGIAEGNLYTDWQSGADFERPQYKKLLRRLKPNDCVMVTSLDRLGRNYGEILDQWNQITRVKQADIVVLDMPLLNTCQTHENLTGRFLADIVLQILSYVAETERHNIRKRQAEGIAAAKARGVRLGRPRKPLPDNLPEIVQRIQRKELTYREAGRLTGISRSRLHQIVISGKI